MQNLFNHLKNDKQGNKRAILIILAVCCLFALISVITIIKNDNNYNTQSYQNENFEVRSGVKRKLVDNSLDVANGDKYVKIGGKPIGISINAGGLIVLGQSEVITEGGNIYPANDTGIESGDIILKFNGEALTSIYQLKTLLETVDGEVLLSVNRGGRLFEVAIVPAVDKLSGQKRLGLMLREDVGGVGTLTFVTQEGKFGALGHYITDADSGVSDELNQGNIYRTYVDGVIKGERGKAGGLIANVNRLTTPIGSIYKNTQIGIYGDYTADYKADLYKIANKGEAKIGAAKVYTTVSGDEPKFYDIDIVKVISQNEAGEKGMVISVTDKELLEKTGGIVQGMSGSPIIQNGILIGAVTHVFVQDPTKGYAVHSRFMYDYAVEVDSSALYRVA